MSERTLYDKVWDAHAVQTLPNGQTQLFVGLHMIHEVTSPQAFGMLEERGYEVAFPDRTFATTDHIVPTDDRSRPFEDEQAETMLSALEQNVQEHGVEFFGLDSGRQGIVHIVGPELGLTQPGMTVVCGDSHTSTHGALGSIGMGIGTSQIRDVFATGCIAADKQDVRRIEVSGTLGDGVYAKDLILTIIRELGVEGGIGYVYEYAGEAVHDLDIEGRLALCNMSIEGGARAGYVNPDDKTFDYLRGREYSPSGEDWDEAVDYWKSIASDEDAEYDDVVEIDGSAIQPMVTWGVNPGQVIGINETVPEPEETNDAQAARKAQEHMDVSPGDSMKGVDVDVAFLGSCTNGRLSDLREAARVLESSGREVHDDVRALAVPGSQTVREKAEEEGLDEIFRDAGVQWREPGCSMCIAMNGDRIEDGELCVSSSNRNYVGRQGAAGGKTVLASPATLAASIVEGEIADPREVME